MCSQIEYLLWSRASRILYHHHYFSLILSISGGCVPLWRRKHHNPIFIRLLYNIYFSIRHLFIITNEYNQVQTPNTKKPMGIWSRLFSNLQYHSIVKWSISGHPMQNANALQDSAISEVYWNRNNTFSWLSIFIFQYLVLLPDGIRLRWWRWRWFSHLMQS